MVVGRGVRRRHEVILSLLLILIRLALRRKKGRLTEHGAVVAESRQVRQTMDRQGAFFFFVVGGGGKVEQEQGRFLLADERLSEIGRVVELFREWSLRLFRVLWWFGRGRLGGIDQGGRVGVPGRRTEGSCGRILFMLFGATRYL